MKALDLLRKVSGKIFQRCDFAILVVFVVLINLPYLKEIYLPYHDARQHFEYFHLFYNNLFWYGDMAQWMPFDTFGLPTNHEQLFGLSSVSYLALLAGWLFKIKDVLFLFKISVLGEQLVLLLGMYCLARYLFKRRSTVFIVCLGATCGFYWYGQLLFDLRMFYMFPLAMYFLVLFFDKKKPQYFWLTGITTLAWVMGCSIYCICMWFFILFVMAFVFFLYDKNIWRCFLRYSLSHVLLFFIFVLLAGAFYYHLKDILGFADVVSRGPGGKNALVMFAGWGGVYGMKEFLQKQIFGSHIARYAGLLPLVFCLWAFIKVRSRYFFPFLAATVALLWISFGGLFAVLCYFFPGMAYYRHLGYLYGFNKILLLLCAGFGWEHFLSVRFKTKVCFLFVILAVLVFLVDSLRIPGDNFLVSLQALSPWFDNPAFKGNVLQDILGAIKANDAFIRIGAYVIVFFLIAVLALIAYVFKRINGREFSEKGLNNIVKILLISVFFFDIFSFEHEIYKKAQRLQPEYQPFLYTLQVSRMKFQEQRTWAPADTRQKDAYAMATRPGARTSYTSVYSFMQFDICRAEPDIYVHMHPKGFTRLLQTKNTLDVDLFRVLACHSPKLRLMTNAVYTDTIEETINLMKGMRVLYDTLVLRGVDEQARKGAAGMIPLSESGQNINIKEFSSNKLTLEADVPGENGAWLVYADSYHPGWHAIVNERKAPVYEAYLAFKAVRLKEGKNTVRFIFRNGINTAISYLAVLFGAVVSMILSVMFLRTLFFSNRDPVLAGFLKRDDHNA